MKSDTLTTIEKPLAVIETRVSDPRQLDGSHELQERECLRLAAELGVEVDKIWKTTVSGSIEDRENFDDILKHVESKKGRVKYYICYSIERFTRSGPSTYEIMKKELRKRGVQMRDVEGVIQPDKNSMENLGFEYSWSRYSPSDTNELLEAGKGRDNKRVMLTRMIGQSIINAGEGYAVHPALDGYTNVTQPYYDSEGKRKRRTGRKRNAERAPFYEKMLELRAEGQKTDEQIVDIVNKMGYLSKVRIRWSKDHKRKEGVTGGIPLTVKQLQVAIQRPGYAGVNYEKWTHWKPVKAQYPGLVSIDVWNRANRGKWYIEEKQDGALVMHKNYTPEDKTHENPLYPYKDVILCPDCRKPFRGSASRSRSGKHYPAYHADHKVNGVRHKRIGVNKHVFEKQVEDFVDNLQFEPALLAGFKLVLMDTFNRRQAGAMQAATDAGKRVIELQEQKQAATRAFIAANTAGDDDLKKDIQLELARLKQELAVAQGYRNSLEITERDLEEFIWRVNWVMEHPQEFLLRAKNKPQRLAYFSLMFDELPTYQDVIDGTPKLAWVFKLDDEPMSNESDMVRRRGLEPPCP